MGTILEQKQGKNLKESIGNHRADKLSQFDRDPRRCVVRKPYEPQDKDQVPRTGLKYDEGKLPYHLLPFRVIDSIVKVQAFGASKYGEDNWQRVRNGKKRYIAAALRHLSAVQQGKRYDAESGLTHLSHALCSLMYAEWLDQQHLKRHKK